jgi:hypothetical protein
MRSLTGDCHAAVAVASASVPTAPIASNERPGAGSEVAAGSEYVGRFGCWFEPKSPVPTGEVG